MRNAVSRLGNKRVEPLGRARMYFIRSGALATLHRLFKG
jgi:hypothetical protein